jgi:hypothetical protein
MKSRSYSSLIRELLCTNTEASAAEMASSIHPAALAGELNFFKYTTLSTIDSLNRIKSNHPVYWATVEQLVHNPKLIAKMSRHAFHVPEFSSKMIEIRKDNQMGKEYSVRFRLGATSYMTIPLTEIDLKQMISEFSQIKL